MKRHKQSGRLIVGLLLALILPILAACGGGQPAANAPVATQAPAANAPADTQAPAADAPATAGAASGTLRIAASLGTWPDTIAPQKSSFSNEIAILLLNYEGLTRFDKDLKTVPGAAEKWEYNQDG